MSKDDARDDYRDDPRRSNINRLFDGCHRYGWVINLIMTLAMFAYYQGSTSERLLDVKERVVRLENLFDAYFRSTRGEAVQPPSLPEIK